MAGKFTGKKNIEAQISINAGITSNKGTSMFEDEIHIDIYDKNAGLKFVELIMTREEFINAVMNRLCNTNVKTASVMNLDKVGKKIECKKFEFLITSPIPQYGNERIRLASESAIKVCPEGWSPDLYFSSQDSFFYKRWKRVCTNSDPEMGIMKICKLPIMYCNSKCPHFYHNFDDHENIYCSKLNQKIYDCKDGDDCIFDFSKRPVPEICPLEDE